MEIARSGEPLRLPDSLRQQLSGFRRRVWQIKSIEVVCAALCGLVAAFLLLFVLDRFVDTPSVVRWALLLAVTAGFAWVPFRLKSWLWDHRKPEQLARLLARTQPRIGDQLLGVIELAQSEGEQARSRSLCEAAIGQVAEAAKGRDFGQDVPNPRHRQWAWGLAVPAALSLALFAGVPDAARNALARLTAPWKAIPRYTFAALTPLPEKLYVPHGEPFTFDATLTANSFWKPAQAEVQIPGQRPITAPLVDGKYRFELPSQIDPVGLTLSVGDATLPTRVEPTLRPELTGLAADITWPAYLERTGATHREIRGGSVALLKGAQASFQATANRDLASAWVDGQEQAPAGAVVTTPALAVAEPRKVEIRWKDKLGLEGREPFRLSVTPREDEPPSIGVEGLPRQKVVLDTEQLAFQAVASDDFGVKRVGLDWQGAAEADLSGSKPAQGERLLAAGGPEKDTLDVQGTFSAKTLGIEPQPVNVRVFVEDYLPGRERVYSPTYTLYVLNAEQHAIYITEQLNKWHRQSLEVRDKELQLLETNKRLRELSAEELDRPETRKRIEAQAAAEKANGRRLAGLTESGADLVQQAMRNPEFGVGHLEKWAEMLQVLQDISANRMPTVADLLKEAAQAKTLASNQPPQKSGPMAGQIRNAAQGQGGGEGDQPKPPQDKPAVPVIADVESGQQQAKPGDKPAEPGAPPSEGSSRLSLPSTTLIAQGGKQESSPPPPPPDSKLDEAIQKQEELLAEFDKVADELNKVLGNLEGSTLVKRLKAASRLQNQVASRVVEQVGDAFGEVSVPAKPVQVFDDLAVQETKSSQDVSTIMDDLQSYYERRRLMRFKSVLDEMRQLDVVGGIRQLGDDLKKESGLSIAQCEFWSDNLDRWAEDLVEPAAGGT